MSPLELIVFFLSVWIFCGFFLLFTFLPLSLSSVVAAYVNPVQILPRWELAPLLLLFLLASLKFGELVLQRWLRKVPTLSKSRREDSLPKVAIVGSGFAGLCLAIKLKLMGVPFVIYEKADSVGGVWKYNKYPGAACDVPSALYQFSFEIKKDWSQKWVSQKDILEYIVSLYKKYDVLRYVVCNAEVLSARFDPDNHNWELTVLNQDVKTTVVADLFVSAVGQLSIPTYPNIEGISSFKGSLFHSARWNTNFSVESKRVAIIGCAASAIQIIPAIVNKVKKLFVFQRTPSYILEKPNQPYGFLQLCLFRYVPLALLCYRWAIYWFAESFFWVGYRKQSWLNVNVGRKVGLHNLVKQVKNRDLLDKLFPKYDFMCKRVLFSSDFYPAIQSPNAELITAPIQRIQPEGVLAGDFLYEVDAIVCATGFKTTEFLSPMEITGRDGRTLESLWKGSPFAYLGVSLAHFPNFFVLYGPNTNLGHNSIIFMIECQCNYICQCIQKMVEQHKTSVELKEAAMLRYQSEVDKILDTTVWSADCASWYRNSLGKVTNNCPFSTHGYWWRTRRFDSENYIFE